MRKFWDNDKTDDHINDDPNDDYFENDEDNDDYDFGIGTSKYDGHNFDDDGNAANYDDLDKLTSMMMTGKSNHVT